MAVWCHSGRLDGWVAPSKEGLDRHLTDNYSVLFPRKNHALGMEEVAWGHLKGSSDVTDQLFWGHMTLREGLVQCCTSLDVTDSSSS